MSTEKENEISIECETSELFPKIHLKATAKDLENYKKNVSQVIKTYMANADADEILRGRTVLEVGCGGRCSGINTLKDFEPEKIYAIDLSEQNVSNTKKICLALGIDNADVRVGNALNLPFAGESFDFVFSNGVIHHTLDTERAFAELCRVLKPGGTIFIGIYGYGGLWGRVVHPLGMFIGKILPVSVAEYVVNKTGILRSQDYSLLDWFYTPIQRKYKRYQIYNWLEKAGFTDIRSMLSGKWFYNMGMLSKVLFGDGYLYFMAKKS